jgi:hypothetical protein
MKWRKWTPLEIEFVRQNAGKLHDKEAVQKLKEIFGRDTTIAAYRKKRTELGFIKKSGRGLCELREERDMQI